MFTECGIFGIINSKKLKIPSMVCTFLQHWGSESAGISYFDKKSFVLDIFKKLQIKI